MAVFVGVIVDTAMPAEIAAVAAALAVEMRLERRRGAGMSSGLKSVLACPWAVGGGGPVLLGCWRLVPAMLCPESASSGSRVF